MKEYTAQWEDVLHEKGQKSGFTCKRKAIQWAQACLRRRLSANGIGLWKVFLGTRGNNCPNTDEGISKVASGSMIVRNNASIHYTTVK